MKFKKATSVLLAAAVTLSLAFQTLGIRAMAENSGNSVPVWFGSDHITDWFATDQADSTGNSWRYTITAGSTSWKYTMHSNLYDCGYAETNRNSWEVDTSATPWLYVKVTSSKATDMYIGVEKNGNVQKLTYASVAAGETKEVKIKFSDISGIEIGADGKLSVNRIGFTTTGFNADDSVEFSEFCAQVNSIPEIAWFKEDHKSDWFATDQADSTGDSWRYTITAGSTSWKYTMHSNLYDCGYAETNRNGITINVNDTPYLYAKVASTKATDLYIGQLVDTNIEKRNYASVAAGETKDIAVKISDIPGMVVGTDGSCELNRTGFTTTNFGTDDSVEFLSFYVSVAPAVKTEDAPQWFGDGDKSNWFATDQADSTADNWRYTITTDSTSWKYTMHSNYFDCGYAETNRAAFTVDTALTPYLYVKVKSSVDSDLYIGVETEDGIDKIKYATLKGGSVREFCIDLTDTEGITVGQDGKVVLNRTGFTTTNFAENDTMEYYSFKVYKTAPIAVTVPSKPGDDVIYPEWLTQSQSGNWWNWDWTTGSGVTPERFTLDYDNNGSVAVTFKGNNFNDLKVMGNTITVNLNETPYLYYNFDCEFDTPVKIILANGGNDGVEIIPQFTGHKEGAIDLRTCEALSSQINNNTLSFRGISFVPTGTLNEKQLVINLFDFAGEGKTYPSSRPAAPKINADTQSPAEQVVLTINAPAGTQRILYKIGASGNLNEYTGPITTNKNYKLYAKYLSEDGFWSVDGEYKVTNIISTGSEDVQPVIPDWFDESRKTAWWSYDWNVGQNQDGSNRFSLDFDDGFFRATVLQSWCDNIYAGFNSERSAFTINLNKQNAVFYKIQSDMDLNLALVVLKADGSTERVSVGKIAKGKSADSIDIGTNSDLLSLSDDDNNITIISAYFTFGAAVNDTFMVERFVFDTEDAYYEGYPDGTVTVLPIIPEWFNRANIENWWNTSVTASAANGEFTVKINDDNDWQADWSNATTLESLQNAITIYLQKNNTLYYRFTAKAPVTVSLNVKNGTGSYTKVKIGDFAAGKNCGSTDLASIAQLVEYGPKLKIAGVILESDEANTITLDRFVFDKADMPYAGYPDDDKIASDKQAAEKVEQAIAGIGAVTVDKKELIESVKKQYNALSDEQKMYVTNLGVLMAADSALQDLLIAEGSRPSTDKPFDGTQTPDNNEIIPVTGDNSNIPALAALTFAFAVIAVMSLKRKNKIQGENADGKAD